MDSNDTLSELLRDALDARGVTVEDLAERTKVPRSTIRFLLGEDISALIPERVYLRGHLAVLANELNIPPEEILHLFDDEQPEPPTTADLVASRTRFGPGTMAIIAGVGCIAILAIVLAFSG